MDPAFFVSWELWQQMTFVLAMAIVVVFCIGIIKLAYTNTLLKKEELLGEEKRAREREMQRTGLSLKRVSEIPFGIRAIEKGVEIDGIWISRPSGPGLATATAIATTPSPLLAKAQAQAMNPKSPPDFPTKMDTSKPYIPTGYNAGANTQGHSGPMGQLGFPPHLSRNGSGHDETMMRLEGKGARPPMQTYVPKASGAAVAQLQQRLKPPVKPQKRLPPQPRPQARQGGALPAIPQEQQKQQQRESGWSRDSASSMNPRSMNPSLYDTSQVPSSSRRLQSPEREWGHPQSGYSTRAMAKAPCLPLGCSESHLPLLPQSDPLPMPEPIFGPGDLCFNRRSRMENPSGTFGAP